MNLAQAADLRPQIMNLPVAAKNAFDLIESNKNLPLLTLQQQL